jgi:hypothetical protein
MSNIDDIFKKGLEEAGIPYTDSHWSAMEKQLPAKTVLPWWKVLVGGVGIITIAAILFVTLNSSDNNSSVSSIDDSETVKEQSLTKLGTGRVSDKLDNERIVTQEIFKSNESLNPNSTENSATPITLQVNSDERISSSQKTYSSENSTPVNLQVDLTALNKVLDEKSLKSSSSNEVFSSDDNDELKVTAAFTEFDFTKKELVTIPVSSLIAKSILDGSSEIKSIKGLRLKYLPKWEWSVSPFTEIASHTNNKSVASSIVDDLDNLTNSTELMSYNYGLKFSLAKGNWSIYSGVLNNKLQEKTNYSSSETYYDYETKLRMIDGSYTTTPRGTRVVLVQEEKVDSTLVSKSVPICTDCNTQINYVSVPIGLQYSFGSRKLTYFGEVAGLYSRLTSVQGDYALVGNSEEIEIREVDITDLNRNIFSGSVAFGIDYKVISRVSIWSSLGVRQTMQSTLKSYDQNARVYPLRVGVKVRL